MSIKIYYTEAEAYDDEDKEMIYRIKCVDGDIFEAEIKTCLHIGNVDEVLESISNTIKYMSK